MKKYALFFNMFLVFQLLENSKSQLSIDYIEYVILLICFIAVAFVMMLIPVALCFSVINNFMKMNEGKRQIKNEISSKRSNIKYLKSICKKYQNASSNFFKSFTALAAWNVFSLIYIIIGFDSFSNGLREYFYFPLNVFQSLDKNKIFDSIYEFQSNWIFMIAIIVLTFLFSFLGEYIGNNMAKGVIKKMEFF